MPDDDRWLLKLPPGWRKVWRYVDSGDSPDMAARATVQALARNLRDLGGIPELPGIADEAVRRARVKAAELDLGLSGGEPLPSSAHLPTAITRHAAAAMVEVDADRLVACSAREARQAVAEASVKALANYLGFDRMVPCAARKGKELRLVRDFVERVLSHPHVKTLAGRLLRHPDGRGLRAPGFNRPKRSTADLLDTSLESL